MRSERANATRGRYSKILALAGMIGVAYLGLTTLILHVQPTGYDPATQVVSDYAVGQYGPEMALGFLMGGVGVVSLSLAVLLKRVGRAVRIGCSLLFVAGVALFVPGAFPTDLEGASTTVHGTIHSILSMVVFTFGPVGIVLLSHGYDRKWPLATILGFAATSVFAVIVQLRFGATGLVERGVILFLLSWVVCRVLPSLESIKICSTLDHPIRFLTIFCGWNGSRSSYP